MEAQKIVKRNNIKVTGQGNQILMLVHGYGCNQDMWRYMVPTFEKDYKVILLDLVGAGQSDPSAYDKTKYNSLKAYGEDIVEICKVLELKDVIFIGHSVSSMIGLHAALLAPEYFKNLVMIGPSPRYINDENYFGGFEEKDIDDLIGYLESNYLGWSNYITPLIMENEDRPELRKELNNSFCQTDPEVAKQFARVTFYGDDREYLSEVNIPTLILQCKSDIIAPYEVGEYVAEQIPMSTFKLLKAKGHCPHMSEPEETMSAIKEFLTNA